MPIEKYIFWWIKCQHWFSYTQTQHSRADRRTPRCRRLHIPFFFFLSEIGMEMVWVCVAQCASVCIVVLCILYTFYIFTITVSTLYTHTHRCRAMYACARLRNENSLFPPANQRRASGVAGFDKIARFCAKRRSLHHHFVQFVIDSAWAQTS